jgi:hypothetical protein
MALVPRQNNNNNNNPYTWLNFVTAATTVGDAIRRINEAWDAGQLAREEYNRLIRTLQDVNNNAQRLYGQLRHEIRDIYYDGMRQIDGPYRREMQRIENQRQSEMQVATNEPRDAPRHIRRNPETANPATPDPTPTPATAQPSTCK